MEFDKSVRVAAPKEYVWGLLLDPHVMSACVPGMNSIEVISEREYVATIAVRVSFVNMRFKLRTSIVEMRAPDYLRSAGTGQDATVTSSLKQLSEIFLSGLGPDETEVQMKIVVELFGRLGTFGMNVMKTKADRMWEVFASNLTVRGRASAASKA